MGSAPFADENYWETQTTNDLITIKPFTQVINSTDQIFYSLKSHRILLINMYVMMKSIHLSILLMNILIISNFVC